MTITEFYQLTKETKMELLTQCCGSSNWVDEMVAEPLVENLVEFEKVAEIKWYECNQKDWLEAFQQHPAIGDINSLKKRFQSTAHFALHEQSAVSAASEKILEELAKGNEAYKKKFSFIFIICATGKSAEEMLNILQSRFSNSKEDEIKIAAQEQMKITKLRLKKLFG